MMCSNLRYYRDQKFVSNMKMHKISGAKHGVKKQCLTWHRVILLPNNRCHVWHCFWRHIWRRKACLASKPLVSKMHLWGQKIVHFHFVFWLLVSIICFHTLSDCTSLVFRTWYKYPFCQISCQVKGFNDSSKTKHLSWYFLDSIIYSLFLSRLFCK